jgi:prepilin-type N-terminal cleavage/methylation domain-containing protein
MKICHKTFIGHWVGRASSRAGSGAAFCKSETRNPKPERSPKAETRNRLPQDQALFELRNSDFIRSSNFGLRISPASGRAGFTMVEIAICLAIIGIALVSIIGVLPIGMHTQRDNREETLINQDATILMEAIRGGARGLDDLTNYVYAITNFYGKYDSSGALVLPQIPIGFTYATGPIFLNNGMIIVGLLSSPEYIDLNGDPITNVLSGGYSNHVVAYVHSISGPAVEKAPQDNDLVRGDSFGYRVLCVNAPVATDTNMFANFNNAYVRQLNANLHELRLTFFWPQLPNGNVGPGRQTFRTMVAGQIVTNIVLGTPSQILYFYQPQSFVNAITNAP